MIGENAGHLEEQSKKLTSLREKYTMIDNLNKRMISSENRISFKLNKIEDWEKEFTNYSYQITALIVGLFVFVLTLLMGLKNFWDFDKNYQAWILMVLILIFGEILIWIILWYKVRREHPNYVFQPQIR